MYVVSCVYLIFNNAAYVTFLNLCTTCYLFFIKPVILWPEVKCCCRNLFFNIFFCSTVRTMWARILVNLLRSPGMDSQPGRPVRQTFLLYLLARLHRLAKWIPRDRFLGSINVYKYGLWTVQGKLELIGNILGNWKNNPSIFIMYQLRASLFRILYSTMLPSNNKIILQFLDYATYVRKLPRNRIT
jgi:hypothetical protein